MAPHSERPEPQSRFHFAALGRQLLFSLAALAVVGAGVLVRSGSAPHKADPTVAKPRAVLFAVRGTPKDPVGSGVAAFIAVIRPGGHDVGVLPVPGSTPTPDGRTLSQIAATASAREIADDVGSELHVNLSGYLIVDASAVEAVFASLARNAPGWPPDLTPQQSLQDLGWPDGLPRGKGSLEVIRSLIKYVPQIQGNANLLVAQVLQGSQTNLSPYEMFVLVTYINDERITPLTIHTLPAALREKQVTH